MSGPTAKDIATELGISTASVSVALNGKSGVSAATRKKILETAAQMGYFSSKSSSPSSNTICFLVYMDQVVGIAQESTFYTFVLQGVEAAAIELGYKTLVRHYRAEQDFIKQVSDLIGDIAGLIILGTDLTMERWNTLGNLICGAPIPFPVVIIDNFMFSPYVDCVGNDNLNGAKSAISYLISQGHRRFGYLQSKQRITNFDERELGARLALQENPITAGTPLQFIRVGIAAENAYRDICQWLDTKPTLPDALFCENDVIAAAAIRALGSYGYHIPEDISIMGFDDIPLCEMVEPPIATIHSFKEKLGMEALHLLHKRIMNRENLQIIQNTCTVKLSLSTRVIPRKSVAECRDAL